MAKKPSAPVQHGSGEIIITANMEDVMRDSMMPYAEHVILERALPRVEDGLKPVQRRILYTMSELGLSPDKPHRKCARIVGDCLGKYHPHGDSSVYDALVRLAQPFSLRGTLVDGHGNFGSIDGDSAAAMRYTEARMAPLALEMLRDIEKDTVPFRLNFDDTLKEPDMLPARYPNLLVNGTSGIAVGLATNIPTHNLGETIDAAVAMIDDPDITTAGLMKHLPCPDFPTGGVLLDTPEIRTAYETGRGKLTLRAKVHLEDGPAGRKLIVITEVPYQVNKAAMLQKILQLSEEKKAALVGIHDIRDESDRQGLRAVVEVKRDYDPQKILAVLYKYSDLQVTFGVNMMAIADGKPELMGLKRVLSCFLTHQEHVVTRRTQYDLDQARARQHILDGLIIAVDNLDEVIRLIRSSKNDKEAKQRLMDTFALSELQAQAILDMRLRRLTNLEIITLREEHEKLAREIRRLEGILASHKKLMAVIREELLDIKARYADPRRTRLVSLEKEAEPLPDDTPVPEDTVVLRTRGGQIRRLSPRGFDKLPQAEDEKDAPVEVFRTQTDATLYFFTDRGGCYPLSVSALPEMNRPKDRGTLPSGLLSGLEKGEAVVKIFCLRPGELEKLPDLLFVTKNGQIKRTEAAAYAVKKAKFAALTLREGDGLLAVLPAAEDSVLLFTRKAMSIRFSTEQVPVNGRVAAGVRAMTLDDGDEIAFAFCQSAEVGEMLLISDRGYAKRVLALDFEPQGRGGKGLKAFTFNKNGSNGANLVGALYVTEPYNFTIRQKTSPATTFDTEFVPIDARAGKGCMLVMALMEDVVTGIERA